MGHHPLHPPKHREFLPEMLGRDERGQHLGHGDHCLGQAGPSARVAASAITSASLLAAVPSAHPPSPLCMRHHNRLPGGGRGRKDGEREPGALPRPQPQTTGFPWSFGSRKKQNKKKSSRPSLLIIESRSFLPSASSRYTLPFPASLCCHDASGLELAPSRRKKAPESSFWRGRETREDPFSKLPTTRLREPSLVARSRRTISERRPCIFNLASICLHPAGSAAASRTDNEGYSGSGALPPCTPAPLSTPCKLRAL